MFLQKNIAYLRKLNGLTQEELSNKVLVTRSSISKWESGTYEPEIDSLKRLSEIFSISIDELIFSDLEQHDREIRNKN